MYIIVQKDKTVSVKLTLNPRPLHEMNKLSEDKHRFAYTLLPDEADPKYQQYRELCEAAPRRIGESESPDGRRHAARMARPADSFGLALRQYAEAGRLIAETDSQSG